MLQLCTMSLQIGSNQGDLWSYKQQLHCCFLLQNGGPGCEFSPGLADWRTTLTNEA